MQKRPVAPIERPHAARHRADAGRARGLHRHRHLRQVAGARRPAHGGGRLRALPRPPPARGGLRAAAGGAASCAPTIRARSSCAAASCSSAPSSTSRRSASCRSPPPRRSSSPSPLWICLLSIPLLGEEVGPRRWAAMFVGFLGVLVVTRPWSGEVHWAVAPLDRRRPLRRALLDHDPQPRRARQRDHAAVLCRAGRDPRDGAARRPRLDLALGRRGLVRLPRHRRLRLGGAPGPHHRPPLSRRPRRWRRSAMRRCST